MLKRELLNCLASPPKTVSQSVAHKMFVLISSLMRGPRGYLSEKIVLHFRFGLRYKNVDSFLS